MTERPIEPAAPVKIRTPFAARVQGLLILVMFAALALIGQQNQKELYKIGLPVLMIAAFLQIAFGNIPPKANFKRSMILLAIIWLIIGGIFVISVLIAPTLIESTR